MCTLEIDDLDGKPRGHLTYIQTIENPFYILIIHPEEF